MGRGAGGMGRGADSFVLLLGRGHAKPSRDDPVWLTGR